MKWIMGFQTPYNMVKFITNEDGSPQALSYYKFLDFVAQFKIKNSIEFIGNIDKFQTILLNCETGEWEVQKPELKTGTFSDMLKLNPGKQEIEEENKKKDPLLRKKTFLDGFFTARKKQVTKK